MAALDIMMGQDVSNRNPQATNNPQATVFNVLKRRISFIKKETNSTNIAA